MATFEEVLPLARLKREVGIPVAVGDHDQLLTEQRDSAVNFVDSFTGIDFVDIEVDDIPQGVVAGCVALARHLYDGHIDLPARRTLIALLAPYRVMTVTRD